MSSTGNAFRFLLTTETEEVLHMLFRLEQLDRDARDTANRQKAKVLRELWQMDKTVGDHHHQGEENSAAVGETPPGVASAEPPSWSEILLTKGEGDNTSDSKNPTRKQPNHTGSKAFINHGLKIETQNDEEGGGDRNKDVLKVKIPQQVRQAEGTNYPGLSFEHSFQKLSCTKIKN